MNEHPPHDGLASEPDPAELARIELASAYVDGDVDAAQRAEVEASSQLMAIVAALQQVRARVVNVPPVSATSRDLAITGALAEFDAMRAESATSTTVPSTTAPSTTAPSTTPPSNVVPIASRTRWTRVLSAAAAVVIVGVVGIVAVNGLHGTKSTSSGAAPAGGLSTSSGSTGTVGGSDKAAPEATIGSIGAPASARIEVDSPAQLLTVSDQYAITDVSTVNTVNTVNPANTVNPSSAGVTNTGVSIASVSSTSTVPTATPGSKVPFDTTITTSSQNAGGGSAPSAPTPAAHQATERPAIPCPLNGHQVVLALISFKGVDAAAVRDTVTGEITALDMQCHVLATAHP